MAELFARLREWNPERGPTNTLEEFLAFCGVYGLGQLASEGDGAALALLRPFASDPRWRVREALAMALQRFGEVEPGALLATAQAWATGNLLEQRAAIAALAEPSLLRYKALALGALSVIDDVTDSISQAPQPPTVDYRVLRQAAMGGARSSPQSRGTAGPGSSGGSRWPIPMSNGSCARI